MEALDQYASKARDGYGEIMRSCIESPDEQMMAEERREALSSALAELTAEHRELVILRFFHRLSAKEIAAVLGTTEGAVRTKLHRILSALREKNSPNKDEL
jgi:RNA polymerase sigma-70 factor (ECF subfamily)